MTKRDSLRQVSALILAALIGCAGPVPSGAAQETTAASGQAAREAVSASQSGGSALSSVSASAQTGGAALSTVSASSAGANAEESTVSSVEKTKDLASHVTGIKDFSIIEGMNPDVMTGIKWDNKVKDVTADTSKTDFTTAGQYSLPYFIEGTDGTSEQKDVKVTVEPDLELYLYGMEGKVEIPLNGTFDPMEHLVWEDQIASVTADTSALDTSKPGDYLLTYTLTAPDGRQQKTERQVTVTDGTSTSSGAGTAGAYSTVTDLGLWRLTAYMDTPSDQGPYVGQTASGAPLVAGRTVAVSAATCSRLGLQFGDRLMIDGHVYVLEDHGGSAMNNQNWVDIFVDNAADAYSDQFNRYSEVYLLR